MTIFTAVDGRKYETVPSFTRYSPFPNGFAVVLPYQEGLHTHAFTVGATEASAVERMNAFLTSNRCEGCGKWRYTNGWHGSCDQCARMRHGSPVEATS